MPKSDFNIATLIEQEKLEEVSFWYRARRDLILWAVKKYCSAAKNFLEIGSGTGFALNGIRAMDPSIKLYGTDLFREGLDYVAKNVPGVGLFQADIRNVPIDGKLDIVGIFDVLEHIDDDAGALKSIYGALNKSGHLVMTVPQHPFLWSPLDTYVFHKRRYVRRELVDKLKSAGFSISCVTSFGAFVLPLKILEIMVRGMKKLCGIKEDRIHIAHPPKFINNLVYMIMKAEYILIGWGMRMPFGPSLLIVAKK